MLAQALIPLKAMVTAKSRLAGAFTPAERRSLAQAMAEHVLATLAAHPLISKVTLVSEDLSAGFLASKYHMDHWWESSLGCRGLNAVIERSCDGLFAVSEQPIVVLHGDLPCLHAEDISTVLASLQQGGGLVIASDRHKTGTNLLAFGAESRPEFAFGPDSFARHCASAHQRGVPLHSLQLPGVALDIDEPQDIEFLREEVKLGRQAGLSGLFTGTLLDDCMAGKPDSSTFLSSHKDRSAEHV